MPSSLLLPFWQVNNDGPDPRMPTGLFARGVTGTARVSGQGSAQAGATLLLYTEGLVERRRESMVLREPRVSGMIGRVPGSNSWEDSAIGTGGLRSETGMTARHLGECA